MQKVYQNDIKIPITVRFNPNKEVPLNVNGDFFKHKSDQAYASLRILLNIGASATYEDILSSLEHETTHAIDYKIKEWRNSFFSKKSIRTDREHKFKGMEDYDGIPKDLQDIMYMLWDTSEFNARQSSYNIAGGNLTKFVDVVMKKLEYANSIPANSEIWNEIRYYLVNKRQYTVGGILLAHENQRDFRKSPLEAVKNYFITVSFNKLKKFIKKAKK